MDYVGLLQKEYLLISIIFQALMSTSPWKIVEMSSNY